MLALHLAVLLSLPFVIKKILFATNAQKQQLTAQQKIVTNSAAGQLLSWLVECPIVMREIIRFLWEIAGSPSVVTSHRPQG